MRVCVLCDRTKKQRTRQRRRPTNVSTQMSILDGGAGAFTYTHFNRSHAYKMPTQSYLRFFSRIRLTTIDKNEQMTKERNDREAEAQRKKRKEETTRVKRMTQKLVRFDFAFRVLVA